MTQDKAIEEICAVRKQISATYGHDVKTFLEHYRALEMQYKEKLIEHRDAGATFPGEQAVVGRSGNV